ncbi:11061_t:CDS:2, partial [Dentiscutata erythropus]
MATKFLFQKNNKVVNEQTKTQYINEESNVRYISEEPVSQTQYISEESELEFQYGEDPELEVSHNKYLFNSNNNDTLESTSTINNFNKRNDRLEAKKVQL